MTDIEQRIADIIAYHWSNDVSEDADPDTGLWLQCECQGKFYHGCNEWSAHVAAAVVEALGLTQEWALRIAGVEYETRYVTKWVPDV